MATAPPTTAPQTNGEVYQWCSWTTGVSGCCGLVIGEVPVTCVSTGGGGGAGASSVIVLLPPSVNVNSLRATTETSAPGVLRLISSTCWPGSIGSDSPIAADTSGSLSSAIVSPLTMPVTASLAHAIFGSRVESTFCASLRNSGYVPSDVSRRNLR